ncbi:MAG: hypothetical protein MI862_26655 [Desulfobacterales bacterium]|nr:hypothetical protein [Desulfobacterales bacterium]
MATISQMVHNRLPDEAVMFDTALVTFILEAGAQTGLEGVAEDDMSMLQKSLIADLAAKALILPAMSHYKKALAKAEGDGAGTAEFVDKLAFLKEMKGTLATAIEEKKSGTGSVVDTGVPGVVVTSG